MEWVETTGRSVAEAKDAALDELGVDEADAEFEVIAEAQTGLFGRLRSEARVRARVRPTAPRPKDDRRNRDRRRRSGGTEKGAPSGSGGPEAPAAGESTGVDRSPSVTGEDRPAVPGRPQGIGSPPAAPGRAEGSSDGGSDSGPVVADGTPASPGEPREGANSGAGARNRRRRRGGRGSRGGGGAGESAAGGGLAGPGSAGDGERTEAPAGYANVPGPQPGMESGDGGGGASVRHLAEARSAGSQGGRPVTPDDDDLIPKGTLVEVDLEEQAAVAVDFLKGLTAEFGVDAEIAVARPDEETVEVQLQGRDLGILIGPKGQTLIAVQNLTRTVVYNETGGNNGRINVDISGYRQKRTEALARFALQVAEQVRSTGQRTALEPMSAVDRKVVHDTLAGVEGVSTTSEGEEPRRRVVVIPS